jgi:hypothetical protein
MKTFVKTSLLLMFTALLLQNALSQDCEAYFPMKEGSYLEQKTYNEKDKLQSTNKMTVLEKTIVGDRYGVLVEVKGYDEKDKEVINTQQEVYCENGVFYVDMKKFLDQQTMESMGDMELAMESENMEFPSNMQPGQMLKDARITLTAQSQGLTIMNMNVYITNRRVEAIEDVTTPAGTYSCYKLTADIETKMMMKISVKSVEWYSKNVGVVKSESYNSKGKLTGYSLLTDYKY